MEKGFKFSISIFLAIILAGGLMFVYINRPYTKIIYMNWSIKLPRPYKEIYSTDSGSSFHGDGWRYHVFEYIRIDYFSNWKNGKNTAIESAVNKNLDILNVPKENRPDFTSKYSYYTKKEQDSSTIYLIFFSDTKKLFVIEDIL